MVKKKNINVQIMFRIFQILLFELVLKRLISLKHKEKINFRQDINKNDYQNHGLKSKRLFFYDLSPIEF